MIGKKNAHLIPVMGFVGLLASCRVPAPTVLQGLEYGFNTPEQAFQSWRTAVQGNLLAREYQCFSREWRRDTGARTLLIYGEVRDEVIRQVPQLRWALHRAEEPEIVMEWERDVALQSRIPGPFWFKDRWLVVRLHREGYWSLWTENLPEKASEGMEFPDPFEEEVFMFFDKLDSFQVHLNDYSYATADTSPEAVFKVEAGYQWKIQEFTLRDTPLDPAALGEPEPETETGQ